MIFQGNPGTSQLANNCSVAPIRNTSCWHFVWSWNKKKRYLSIFFVFFLCSPDHIHTYFSASSPSFSSSFCARHSAAGPYYFHSSSASPAFFFVFSLQFWKESDWFLRFVVRYSAFPLFAVFSSYSNPKIQVCRKIWCIEGTIIRFSANGDCGLF